MEAIIGTWNPGSSQTTATNFGAPAGQLHGFFMDVETVVRDSPMQGAKLMAAGMAFSVAGVIAGASGSFFCIPLLLGGAYLNAKGMVICCPDQLCCAY